MWIVPAICAALVLLRRSCFLEDTKERVEIQ